MQIKDIKAWRVYLCRNCHNATPPKDKYVIVAYKDGDIIWGFFINTKIPKFIEEMPHLLKCEAPISGTLYSHFLKYDSHVHCHTIHPFRNWDLNSRIDKLKSQTIRTILEAIQECETIENKHKSKILAESGHYLDGDS